MELECPITCDWLEDPIQLPCCGRCVSRIPLKLNLEQRTKCPLCNADISNFNVDAAPKAVNIAYLVEEAKKAHGNKPIVKKDTESKWTAKMNLLIDEHSVQQKLVARLEFVNTNNKFAFKTLLVPVIDRSGSMAGGPMKQAKYSLNRVVDLTYKNSHIETTIIAYHDTAEAITIDKLMPQSHYEQVVTDIDKNMGGTQFPSAFAEIVKVCQKHKDNAEITSIVVIFLTDGGDGSGIARDVLVADLKTKMAAATNKKYTIHTVGFGVNHDYAFLNGLRIIGTHEGAYRYADPSEDADSLSNKINSLLNVIVSENAVPLQIVHSPVTIISGQDTKYWIELPDSKVKENISFKISVNNADTLEVQGQFCPFVDSKGEEDNTELWQQWYSYLTDNIAAELLELSSKPCDTLDKQIHLEMLVHQCKFVMAKLTFLNCDTTRVEKLMDSVKAFQKGEVVDQKKLNDMKFEGTYATKAPTAKPAALPAPTVQPIYGADQTVFVPQGPWVTIPRTIGKRCHSAMISQNKNSMVLDILNNTPDIYTQRYQNNANLLMVATSIGRCAIVKAICEAKVFDINEKDNNGRTALDMAALHGYWKTYDVLVGFGATLSVDTELLLRTCLSNRYYNLSTRLVKENKVVVTDDMISAAPTSAVYQWLNKMGQRDIPIDIAIRKGLFETVKTKLDTIDKIALKDCLNIFHGNDPDYFNILELLVNTHKVDPNEIIDIMVDDEKEITWPLFIACEEGKMDFFNLLIPFYRRPEQLNMQNKRGTTVLWIASCNRHIDIVNELLQRGADPNIPNLKGDSALVSCCQKNNSTLAELLLSAGARLDIYNKNRDNPVLICCRTGHAKVLEMLLKTLKPDELKTILNAYAEIDGFVPILASTELDRVDCIRMCVKYGAPLETKTADDNKIIAGATSMHLACHYGRLNAAKTLHELGASLVATTVDGLTPLHVAIQKGHAQVVRFLLTTQGGKDSLHIKDKQGRLPAFYASMLGNEHIKEEFFTDRLALLLEKALHVEPSLEQKCAIVLSKYGRNLHDRLVLDNNTPLMTAAILNNSKYMIDSLTHLGVDVYKKDDFGLSPMFWSAYTGCDIGHEPDPETCELIDRLKVVQKKNLQNKLLLNFSEDTKQLLLEAPKESDNNNFNVTMKMSSNYFTKIKKEVITALEKTQSSQSLLGFLEKLKNNKLVKVDTVMRDAKVHLISLVASGEKVLDPAHLLALYLYTSSMAVFNQVNLAMSEWEKHKIWQPYVMCMYQGLKLLDPFVGEAYRVVDIPFDPFEYKVGTLISWNTFSIASKSWIIASEQINKKKGVIFIIKSKTGRDVSKYSKFTVDQEVMFLPNCVFEVTNLYKPDIVALGQENIRATTFGASEKDLERAGLGQAAIIVDISEKVAMPTVLDV